MDSKEIRLFHQLITTPIKDAAIFFKSKNGFLYPVTGYVISDSTPKNHQCFTLPGFSFVNFSDVELSDFHLIKKEDYNLIPFF